MRGGLRPEPDVDELDGGGPGGLRTGQVTGSLARNGRRAAPYVANTAVNQSGNYALTVPCRTAPGDPPADPELHGQCAPGRGPGPAAHAAARSGGLVPPGYIVDEGTVLTVDASESTAPEAIDRIVKYRVGLQEHRDLRRRQRADHRLSDRHQRGLHRGPSGHRLVGRDATAQFKVTVRDANPFVAPGGPYSVVQGAALTVDGRATHAGSAADTVSRYRLGLGRWRRPHRRCGG